jgi:hypothetical protein
VVGRAIGAVAQRRTKSGHLVLEEIPMLALDPHFLQCTVYLYRSIRDAEDGVATGGCGFIVSVNSRHPNWHYCYLVTNKHVIDGGNHFVRFNTLDDTGVVEAPPEAWTVSAGDDLAAVPYDRPGKEVEWLAISTKTFVEESCEIEGWPIFLGDEVLLPGRFISHDGRQRNKPVLRFGNVSMLPDAKVPVQTETGDQVAFLVECRSLSGFSGSPAFITLSDSRLSFEKKQRGWTPRGLRFLGVDCGHFPFWSNVREKKDTRSTIHQDMYVETNSGIAVVVPAGRLRALLNQDHFVKAREAADRRRDEVLRTAVADTPSADS